MSVDNLWTIEEEASDRGDRQSHQRFVVSVVKRDFKSLYGQNQGVMLSIAEMQQLMASLSKDQSPLTVSFRLKFLNSVLRKGIAKLGWRVPMALLPVSIAREPSPFSAALFAHSNDMRNFERAFITSLGVKPNSERASMGRALVSAIIFGGYLKQAGWDNWLQSAHQFDGHSLTIRSDDENVPPMRWFPDPLTARLLKTLPSHEWLTGSISTATATRCIKATLADSLFDNVRPTSLKILRDWAELRLRLTAPPFLVEYALAGGPSVSLPEEAWQRLLTGRKPQPREPVQRATPRIVTSGLAPEGRQAPRDTVMVLRSLRLALRSRTKGTRKPSRAAAAAAIASTMQKQPCDRHAIGMLLEWAKLRLSQPRSDGGLEPATVGRYLTPIAEPLLAFAGAQNWQQFEAEDLAEMYLDIISRQTSDSERAMAGQALANFHQVVLSLFPSLEMDLSEIRHCGDKGQVNANIITGQEFNNAKRNLIQRGGSWRERIPVTILIFGNRAGLRRNEAITLPLSSIRVSGMSIELTLRRTPYGGLKSSAGTRRLPLHDLLTEKEAAFIRRWLADRPKGMKTVKDPLLFCDGIDPRRVLSAAEVFNPIRAAMQHATGDPDIRFHSNRHSFATYLLLCLIVPNGFDLSWLTGLTPDLVSVDRQTKLKEAFLGRNRLGQSALHAVSQALGHSDVRVTLSSYTHLADVALWAFVSQNVVQPKISDDIKASLSQITPSAVRTMRSRRRHQKVPLDRGERAYDINKSNPTSDAHIMSPRREADRVRSRTKVTTPRVVKPIKRRVKPTSYLPLLGIVGRSLTALGEGKTAEDCARGLKANPNDVGRWFERSQALSSIKTQKGGYRHRSTGKPATRNSLCPSRPTAGQAIAEAEKMWAAISADKPALDAAPAALRIFAQRFQPTGSRVGVGDRAEHASYHGLLVALGVKKTSIDCTVCTADALSNKNKEKSRARPIDSGHVTVRSTSVQAASAALHYVLRMLIIVLDFRIYD
jgi:hypothetical protein